MSRLSFIVGSSLVLVTCSRIIADAPSQHSKTIPLNQIWAYRSPGMRNIFDLDVAPADRPGKGLIGSVLRSWMLRAEKLKYKDVARPGFAVAGDGRSALRVAHSIFINEEKPRDKFSADEEITIVFFSEPAAGNRVQIQQVKREVGRIEIQYRLEPYFESSLSETFALIPLGKMPVGEYRVEMRQLPLDKKYNKWERKPIDEEWSNKFLCKRFSFAVVRKRE
jgi:hypothetical protein